MLKKCNSCDQFIRNQSPVDLFVEAYNSAPAVEVAPGVWYQISDAYQLPIGSVVSSRFGDITVVQSDYKRDFTNDQFSVIFGFDNRYFKVEGRVDSYGDGELFLSTAKEVQSKTKTVTVFE